MDQDNPSDQASLPSQPQYAQMKARHRPSPKGEQRLWLYQCAVKSCSKGEMKIAGTSRPKGRDVPSCGFCGGKMHWKGTERDPAAGSISGPSGAEGFAGASLGPSNNLNIPERISPGRESHSPPHPAQAQLYPATSSFHPVPPNPIPPIAGYGGETMRLTPGSGMTASQPGKTASSPSPSPAENRSSRPWEL